ncbi:unnamed protein product [Bursaphelenchus xylophilus]|uniref:(pine wood nematode) hypothetical protein n=1 Tax=Bursaphelenchus xylophilus TaxID=6326 RepID=A0A7I8WLP2_BURXY|nr:unnamed protein product [Bursaphelenchus xylophilus]CAG9105127.1 unnamed protein product [Bursaphelenchus xylophilus]
MLSIAFSIPFSISPSLPPAHMCHQQGEEFMECGPHCEETCDELRNGTRRSCVFGCRRGCFCDHRHVRYRGKCITRTKCTGTISPSPPKFPLLNDANGLDPNEFEDEQLYSAENGPQDPRCQKNAYLKSCADICPKPSCHHPKPFFPCFSLRCGRPRCECKEKHVYKDEQRLECVHIDKCPMPKPVDLHRYI